MQSHPSNCVVHSQGDIAWQRLPRDCMLSLSLVGDSLQRDNLLAPNRQRLADVPCRTRLSSGLLGASSSSGLPSGPVLSPHRPPRPSALKRPSAQLQLPGTTSQASPEVSRQTSLRGPSSLPPVGGLISAPGSAFLRQPSLPAPAGGPLGPGPAATRRRRRSSVVYEDDLVPTDAVVAMIGSYGEVQQ